MGKIVSAFTNDALGNMDAMGVAAAIAKKEISVQEATEAAIARAEKVNGDLNAIVVKTYNDARKNTPAKGAFYGVPAFIKDNENIAGYPTQLGTGSFNSRPAKAHSSYVKQFLSTGINYLGKTTLPEFGLICSTENERWGITRNPWNTDYTTGGSSSGSAAMVASGVVPIASANDGAGSIRIPACCCGLVGLKPSRHRLLPVDGTELMPLKIIHQGVLTRSVRDTAAFFAEAEKYYSYPKLAKMGFVQHAGKQRLRIGVVASAAPGKLGYHDADTRRSQQQTAQLLQSMGHIVEEIPLPFDIDEMSTHYLNYYGFMAYMLSHWGGFVLKAKVNKQVLEPFTLGLSQQFKNNALKTPGSIKMLRRVGLQAEKLFEKYDVLMTPVVSHATPPIGHFSTSLSYNEVCRRAIEYASFTGLQNVTGWPAISLPLSTDSNNMPLGVHFTAPYGHDVRLLELAYELEEAQPFKTLVQTQASTLTTG